VEEAETSVSEIEAARLAVERAGAARDQLVREAEATRQQLLNAQHVVGRAIADVVRQELLIITKQIDEHDRAAAELRDSLRRAGYVTANAAGRAGWPRRIFTSTMLSVLDRGALDVTSRADWQGLIARLDRDFEASFE
jgi:hypothetical protein